MDSEDRRDPALLSHHFTIAPPTTRLKQDISTRQRIGHFYLALTGIELRQVTPGLAGRFIEELPGSDPTRNLALAALRHFFDTLVTRHAVALNSFSSITALLQGVYLGRGQVP